MRYRWPYFASLTAILAGALLSACESGDVWQRAQWRVHEQEVNDAIARYHNDFGVYPTTLADLVPDYLPETQTAPDAAPEFLYDPTTGRALAVTLIEPTELARMKAVDEANVADLNQALDAYRRDHGESPRSLDELTPAYLPTLPTGATAASEYFYAASVGEVALPPELQALYDSLGTTEDVVLSPEEMRATYDEEVDKLDSINELSDGNGYPDPREVLADGTAVFERRQDAISEESGVATETRTTSIDESALDRYEQSDPAAWPSPGEVLTKGKQVFTELYGTNSDPALRERNEKIYDEHVDENGDLDKTNAPTAEEVLESGEELFHAYTNADGEP